MDPEKVAIGDGKAFVVNNMDVKVLHIDPDYDLEKCPRSKITPTGLLTIAKLNPKKERLPKFIIRWDERADTIDIDIYGVSKTVMKYFRNDTNGYRGHHPEKIMLPEGPIYLVNIEIPRRIVFIGFITELSLSRMLAYGADVIIVDPSQG